MDTFADFGRWVVWLIFIPVSARSRICFVIAAGGKGVVTVMRGLVTVNVLCGGRGVVNNVVACVCVCVSATERQHCRGGRGGVELAVLRF